MATLTHHALDVGFDLLGGVAVPDRKLNQVDLLIARDTPLEGPQRHDHQIVLIRAHGALTLACEKPDHLAGDLLESDLLTDGILVPEQLAAHRRPDHAHRPPGTLLGLGEEPPVVQSPVAHREEAVVAAGDRGRPIAVAHDGRHDLTRRAGDGTHGADLALHRDHVVQGEGRCVGAGSRPHALAHGDHQQVGSETFDLRRDLPGRTVAEGHHDNDRRHADDNAQHGQDRTQDVSADLAQGQQEGIPEH